MTILDRYIIKSFFFNLVLWLVCILGIYIIFDLFTNMDGLIQAGKAIGNIPKVILMYYLFKSIPIAMMLSSLLGLLSAMITTAMMMRNNELIPIQAAGISTVRIIRPLIASVALVTIVSTVCREFVLPNYLDELVMNPEAFVEEESSIVNATIDNTTQVTIQGDRIYRRSLRISKPSFVLHKPVVKQATYLRAGEALHYPETPDRPAGFMLVGVTTATDIVQGESLRHNGRTILMTHRDAPDWIEKGDCFVVSDVPFDYLASSDAWQKYASTWSLFQAARNNSLDVGDRIHATIHGRVLQPILDFSILFLGLPIILTAGDRNVFKAMGISGLIVLAFLVVNQACQHAGGIVRMPVLGAWLPLMIFGPIAVNQFLMLRDQ